MAKRYAGAGLFAAIALLAMVAGPHSAQAAPACPALPNAESTFSGALTNLINKATGKTPSLSSVGDPVKQLNASQQQKVLGWLRGELAGRRAAIAADREKSEAEKKVEDLKRRIFTRDRIERDQAVVGRREIERTADGTILPARAKGKSLGEIIDQEMARDEPTLAAKYKDKYKKAILAAIEADPARAGEFAGALSAGDYTTVIDYAADWGAQGFGTIVSDALGEIGEDRAKVVWDKAIQHAGAAKNALIALNQGNPEAAWKVMEDEWKKEVKTQSRAALKAAINFAFDAGSGAGTVGDFVPIPGAAQNVLAPGVFGLTPGDIYLKILDAEVAFINWSKDYLRRKWTKGDGACIGKYNEEYQRLGNAADAYEAFDHCISTARYSGMFEFANNAKQLGVDPSAAIRQYLEAQRRGMLHTSTPAEWMKAKLAAKKKALARQMLPELSRTEKVMASLATAVGSATKNRLTELASAALNENQWEQLADEIRELESKLDETLAVIDRDLNRVRRYSGAVKEWCDAYDREKVNARQALADGLDVSVKASNLRDRIERIDTAACQEPEPAADASESGVDPAALSAAIEKDRAALQAETDKVCAAAEDIRNAENKQAARARLDAALASAREVKAIAARLNTNADALSAAGAEAGSGPQAEAAAARDKVLSEIAAAKGDLDALAGEADDVQNRFRTAHDAMRDAQRRTDNITDPTEKIIEEIKACLRPLAFAPAGERPRQLLEELQNYSTSNVGCRGVMRESWYERDQDPPVAGRMSSSAAWQHRSLSITPTPDDLRGLLQEVEAKCPAAEGKAGAGEPAPAAQTVDPDAAKTAAAEAVARMERCAAEALVAYNDNWGKGSVELSDATCSPDRNAEILSKLRQHVADGAEEAKAHLAKLEPVVAAVSKAHASYDAAKQQYSAGDLSAARASLTDAKSAVGGFSGSPDCSALIGKIDSGLDKIDRLERIIARARDALNSCDGDTLLQMKQQYGSVTNSELQSLLSKGDAIVAAKASYEQAKASYSSGNLGAAESSLRGAKQRLSSLGGAACADLRERVTSGLDRIERLRDAIAEGEQAVASCDVPAIKRSRATLANVTNPAASAVKRQLDKAEEVCKEREREERVADISERCVSKFGAHATAEMDSVHSDDPRCACASGYKWNDNQTACIRAPTKEEIQAQNNATCRKQNGPGYYAGPANKKGVFYCRPTKATANAWCRRNNKGPGIYAGRVKADGSFDCHRSRKGQAQIARANCIRQYGNRFIRLVRRNGQYLCEYSRGGGRRQPQHSAQNSAAVIGAIGGIIGAIGNNRGTRGGTRGGGRNCHHQRNTSATHCGSN